MPRLKRTALELLDRDATLYDTLLARMVGAMGGGVPVPAEVCREMGVTFGGVLAWINADGSGERLARWKAMQEVRGQVLAEDALTIADTHTDPEAIPSARLRVDTRFRLAKAYSPRVFDQDVPPVQRAPVSISIMIGDSSGGADDGHTGRTIEHDGDGGAGASPGGADRGALPAAAASGGARLDD